VSANGKVTVCRERSMPCLPNWDSNSPVLHVGERVTGGGTTCSSKRSGIVCKADRSGQGFRINARKVERVG
jgi:hypothetical protein